MGIAILSGVIASLEHQTGHHYPWASHTPGTTTPTGTVDASLPSRFIACVNRQDSARKLKEKLKDVGRPVEIAASRNLKAVQQSDVVLLWWVIPPIMIHPFYNVSIVVSPSWHARYWLKKVSRKHWRESS
jgi:hypothetical protein